MSKGRLLIVDDDAEMLRAIAAYFTRLDFDVTAVLDGETALKMLEEDGPFDAMLSDVLMPSMNGLELAKRARASSPTTPILLISSYELKDGRIDGVEPQADDYLPKPFSCRELERRVNKLIQGARAIR